MSVPSALGAAAAGGGGAAGSVVAGALATTLLTGTSWPKTGVAGGILGGLAVTGVRCTVVTGIDAGAGRCPLGAAGAIATSSAPGSSIRWTGVCRTGWTGRVTSWLKSLGRRHTARATCFDRSSEVDGTVGWMSFRSGNNGRIGSTCPTTEASPAARATTVNSDRADCGCGTGLLWAGARDTGAAWAPEGKTAPGGKTAVAGIDCSGSPITGAEVRVGPPVAKDNSDAGFGVTVDDSWGLTAARCTAVPAVSVI
jgi:hypothetical protein